MAEPVLYVYGIVSGARTLDGAPPGLDEQPVLLERAGRLAALVSRLDASAYDPELVAGRAGDVAWVGPRAVAHDAVLTWASATDGVIPLPMFTLFRTTDSLEAMMRDRAAALEQTLARVSPAHEYGVRMFRVDAELAPALGAMSESIAELERSARAASPGQRYLLERKLESERAREAQRITGDVVQQAFATLTRAAEQALQVPLPPGRDRAGGRAVLDAAFLVRRDAVAAFERAVRELANQEGPRGFRFELTGPWPPYHFVDQPT